MVDLQEGNTVSVLPESEWDSRLAAARADLPFAWRHWLTLGLKDSPDLRFVPTAVRYGQAGEALLALCVRGERAQIGCYGYGSVAVSADWRGELPGFADLAEAVCRDQALSELSTLLPPTETCPGTERWYGRWPTRPGRQTYLLDLDGGADAVWTRARGRSRTAVRRARALGLDASVAEPGHETDLLRLHHQTMGRNGVGSAYGASDIAFLLDGDHAVTTVVADDNVVHAASVFAVSPVGAFHVMQLTSPHGRVVNAGHLAFWAAVGLLAERGVGTADLGAAVGQGQEKFKAGWGAVAAETRVVRWPAEEAR